MTPSRILLIDDDRALCRSIQIQLEGEGIEVVVVHLAEDALQRMDNVRPDAILLDLHLPDMDGLEFLERIATHPLRVPVIMITARQDMEATIQAMKLGAFDYIRKPFDLDDVRLALEKALLFRAGHVQAASRETARPVSESPDEIVGNDPRILDVVKQIGLLARSRVTVLIEGESGTGKELVARAVHRATSPREPFVAVNCSAVVPTLFESELFGHEKGAFTGADRTKAGKLEYAADGTLFLDEIGDLPLELQPKILRVLQEMQFEPVGGLRSIPFRARFVAATNRDLATMVAAGSFREDLFYRLSVSRIVLPPLRERRRDIPLLARHLLYGICNRLNRPMMAIDERAMQVLVSGGWPGNVRELENVLTRAVALARGTVLGEEDLQSATSVSSPVATDPAGLKPLSQVEREYIEQALLVMGWNISRTAQTLEISPTTLRKKIADFGLERPPDSSPRKE